MGVAYQFVMEVLSEFDGLARQLDPSGDAPLRLAKQMRMDVMRNRIPGDPMRLSALASKSFGLPGYDLELWTSSVHQRPWNGRQQANLTAEERTA